MKILLLLIAFHALPFAYEAIDSRNMVWNGKSVVMDCYDTTGVMANYSLYAEDRARAFYRFAERININKHSSPR